MNKQEKYKAWDEFLNIWPLQRVSSMTLKEYNAVGDKTTFCYYIESLLDQLGSIWGGSAFKFGIFEQNKTNGEKEDSTSIYSEGYAWYKKYGRSADEAFRNVKGNIIKVIEAAQQNKLELIDNIDLGHAYKWKIAFQYQNREQIVIVPIFAEERLACAAGGNRKEPSSTLYREIFQKKPAGQDIFDYSDELGRRLLRIWKISHGKGQDAFSPEEVQKYRSEHLVVVHRDTPKGGGKSFEKGMKIGDFFFLCRGGNPGIYLIGQIETDPTACDKGEGWLARKYKIISQLSNPYPINNGSKGWMPAYNSTCKLIPYGDLPIFETEILHPAFKMGLNELVNRQDNNTEDGSDLSLNDYIRTFEELDVEGELKDYHKALLRYNCAENLTTGELAQRVGLANYQAVNLWYGSIAKLVCQKLNRTYQYHLSVLVEFDKKSDVNGHTVLKMHDVVKQAVRHFSWGKSMSQPLNIIYYGPPGTGKTYEMLKIADAHFTETKATLSKVERIAKIIEDLSWWEVIALCMLDIARPLKVPEIMDHEIMKAQARRSSTKKPASAVWAHLQIHTKDDCENVNYNNRSGLRIFSKDDKGFWSIDRKVVEEQCSNLIDALDEYHSGSKLEEKIVRYTFVTFHQSFSYEDFVEGIKPVMDEGELRYALVDGVFKKCCQNAAADPQHDYAIFIDEINRGNVAAIFGELITLIEPDKRKGAKNELATRLPYSKVDFSVPSNLHVIGTMNTADRSIEVLDTALRRRFSFKELQSKPELLAEEAFKPNHLPLALDMMLKKINERVEFLLDRDHAIGHSYFLKIQGVSEQDELDKLNRVFRDNILPLLEEYFYGDLAKVYMVLGPAWILRSKQSVEADQLLFTDNADAVDFNEKYQFNLLPIENKTVEAFLSIYDR